jgi:F-type H+-transporting ATPase subunit b
MGYLVLGLPRTVAQEAQQQTEEHPAGAEEHNPILPEPGELIFGALAFLLVFWVLARYAFPRLNEAMKARTEKIQGDLEKAEGARSEAESALKRYEEQQHEARAESGRIIDDARKTAEKMRKDLLAKAEDEARLVVSKAQEEIRAERERAFQELRRQVGELTVDLAERVVGENLNKERQLKLVDGYIEELAGTGDGNERKGSGGS